MTIEGNAVFLNKTGNTLNVEGSIDGGNNFAIATNGSSTTSATINIKDGAVVKSNSTAIYLPGKAIEANVSGGTITGVTGIEIRAGELNVTGGTITATGSTYSVTANGSGTTTNGAAIAVAQHTTGLETTVNISGGTLTGPTSLSIANPQNKTTDNVNVTVDGGTLTGNVESSDTRVTGFIHGGTIDGTVAPEDIAQGTTATTNAEGSKTYTQTSVAKIGETLYGSLADAIAAVGDGETITMLGNVANAAGLKVASGKNFTVDFAGYTYTLNKPGAGSTNTETNGFQLLKNSTIVFKNGTINIAADNLTPATAPAKNIMRIIQNYANLTLEDMTIDGSNQYGGKDYIVSFNNGTSAITGSTSIIAEGADSPIMDVCQYKTYPQVNVTINTTGTIGGDIEISASNAAYADNCSLTVESANVEGTIKQYGTIEIPVTVSGGTFDVDVADLYAADDKMIVKDPSSKKYTVVTPETLAGVNSDPAGSGCYRTYYNASNNMEFKNAEIYTVVADFTAGKATVNKVEGNVVPKKTAVLLKSETTDVKMAATAETATVGENSLVGGAFTVGANEIYVFGADASHPLGFYIAEVDNAETDKAYILGAAVSGAKSGLVLDFAEGGVTGITGTHVERTTTEKAIYNLNGQKLSAPKKGLNIINGRKVVIQ